MMKLTVTKLISAIVFSFFHLCMQAQGNRLQCDESCAPGATGAVKYNVVSPVGFSTVDPIEMAPRLTSLNGKTIAIVGEDFMNNGTACSEHPRGDMATDSGGSHKANHTRRTCNIGDRARYYR